MVMRGGGLSVHPRLVVRVAAVLAGVLLAGCGDGGGVDDRVMGDTLLEGGPQAEVWIGSNQVPEEEPVEVGDQVRIDAVKVIRASQNVDPEIERRARMVWTSRHPAVATVDSAGRVTAVAPGRATIVAQLDPATLPAWAPAPTGDSLYVRVVPANAALASLRFRGLTVPHSEVFSNNCAVTDAGVAYCWGRRLQDGEESSTGLRPVPGGARFGSVMTGALHTCGLTVDGQALCWGKSEWGALGTGSTRPAPAPVAVEGGLRFVQLSAGRQHTCGVTAARELYCWGINMAGELGAASNDRCTFQVYDDRHRLRREQGPCSLRPVRVLADRPVRAVATGNGHTCALDSEGAPWCWGDDLDRQAPRRGGRPTRVATDQRFTALWAGSRHTCALTAAGQAYCWGRNWLGQLGGEAARKGSRVPIPVGVEARFTSLAAGDEHTCGIAVDGRAWCWGRTRDGALGSGVSSSRDMTEQQPPKPVARGLRFRQLAAGSSHTCGVTIEGGLFCWGSSLDFDLGEGALSDRPEPVRIAGPPG